MSRIKWNYELVIEFTENKGYKLLSTEYKKSNSKLTFMCNEGHVFEMNFSGFKKLKECPICTGKWLNYDVVKKYIENENYVLLSNEYINNRTKLKIKCSKGHVYLITFDNYKNGYRCPICKSSKGEKKVNEILDKYNIKYYNQYKFNDCKFKQQLPFDFYLPDYNCCIEYDGIQHYKIVKRFGGFNGFIDTKIRDTIKNIYCKNNNIELLRISYLNFDNIENIIINKLKTS